jgi:hypothetical protein
VIPELDLPPEEGVVIYPLGVSQAVGILFGHFAVEGPGVDQGPAEKLIVEQGGHVLDMIQYEPPPMLKSLYDPKMQDALSRKVQEALKNAKEGAASEQPKR